MHVIGISYDSLSTLKRFSRKNGITFPLLSDHGSKVIDAYGLLNSDAANTRLEGIPHPGTMVINKQGVVIARLFLEDYRKRHRVETMLTIFKKLRESSSQGK
jgi:peroxiredoxin